MPEESKQKPLDESLNLIEFEQVRTMYNTERSFKAIGIFLMGMFGSGKTQFICTGRKPILIDSFDPRGTVVIETNFPEQIKNGDILIRRFWDDSHKKPFAFREWEKAWDKLASKKLFDRIGTYAIDSATFWTNSLGYEVSKETHIRNPKSNVAVGDLEIGDYKVVYNTAKTYIRMMSDFDCDFIVTCHLETAKDELTGEITNEPTLFNRLKSEMPALFTEKYVIERKGSEPPTILTSPKGRDRASTQIGSGKFDLKEVADIKHLLKKAGLPYQDKAPLFSQDKL